MGYASARRLLLVQRVRGELRLPPALALVVPVDGAGAPHAAGDAIGRRQELEPAVAGQPAVAAGVDAAREPVEAAAVGARFFDAAREARHLPGRDERATRGLGRRGSSRVVRGAAVAVSATGRVVRVSLRAAAWETGIRRARRLAPHGGGGAGSPWSSDRAACGC